MKCRTDVFLLSGFAIVASIALGGFVSHPDAQQPNRVGLIVDFGDHHIARCIEFTESQISGYDVLRRAGLDVVVDTSNAMGVIVCDIDNTSGCPTSNCFCECQGSPCVYWAYHRLVDGSWQYSQLGASSQKVQDGDVEGWAWGEGTLNTSGAKPPLKTFEEICAPPTSTPIPPTETPEDTPVPELVVWFRLDQNPISAGSCTMLRWDTSNAQEVYLDGEEVDPIGSREVCPTEPQEYNLRVVSTEDEETHTLMLGVTGGVTGGATASPTIQPTTAPPSPTSQAATTAPPSPTPSPESTTTSTPSPSATAQPTSVPTSTPTPEPTTSPSPTPPPPTPTSPPPSPTESAQSDAAHRSDDAGSALLYSPATYAAFALIAGGLLAWLLFLAKVRK